MQCVQSIRGAWWISAFVNCPSFTHKVNRWEKNLYVLTPHLLPWVPDQAPKMWRICLQVALLWLWWLFWWGALIFPQKLSCFAVFLAMHVSNMALLLQIWAALWEVLSSWFEAGQRKRGNLQVTSSWPPSPSVTTPKGAIRGDLRVYGASVPFHLWSR